MFKVSVLAAQNNVSDARMTVFLKGKLSSYKVPSQIFFIDEKPMSAMNKIQKKELQCQFALPLT